MIYSWCVCNPCILTSTLSTACQVQVYAGSAQLNLIPPKLVTEVLQARWALLLWSLNQSYWCWFDYYGIIYVWLFVYLLIIVVVAVFSCEIPLIVWYMMYDIWYMICDVWHIIYDVWYMIYDMWCMTYNIWMIYDRSCCCFLMRDSLNCVIW